MLATDDQGQPNRLVNIQGYDRWADFYDHYPNPTVAMDELAFPPIWAGLSGKRVLEIGCGTGRHTTRLVKARNIVTGIDQSARMLSVARKKLGTSAILLEGDFLLIDPGVGVFDAALAALVVEHIADLVAFFRHVAKTLKPGAEFYLSEIHPARTAAGTFAHFKDADTGQDVALAGFPHTETDMLDAASTANFRLVAKHDVMGDERLVSLNPKWAKHQGKPMLQLWHFALCCPGTKSSQPRPGDDY
jgi:malonyl-CoA O-methyltransferase